MKRVFNVSKKYTKPAGAGEKRKNMFAERLNRIFDELDASNARIAALSGFDRTNVSHLRRGAKTPGSKSPTIKKLTQGIFLYAERTDRLPAVCALIGIPAESSPDELREAMTEWLFENEEQAAGGRRSAARGERNRGSTFGRRLDAVMDMIELSNVRLSRLINVDASLISRYRSGMRTPKANPELAAGLCSVLWERVVKGGRENKLADLMNFPAEELDEVYFRNWMCRFDDQKESETSAAEDLLDAFDNYTAAALPALPPLSEAVPEKLLSDKRKIYLGTQGLRDAVLRFLGNTALSGGGELRLYSDEKMDWMVGDPSFRVRWAVLMSACVRNGVRIRIIHNIDRGMSEMNSAITSWLPLYMSGMIESFYLKHPGDRRFSHTIFLRPGEACIGAFHVIGTEKEGLYHYYTGEDELGACANEYRQLLSGARPLLRIPGTLATLPPESGEETAGARDGKALYYVRNTLSLATMPRETAESFGSEALMKAWEARQEEVVRTSPESVVNECAPIAADEALFSGSVPVEAIPGGEQLFYTPEQYAKHIGNILRFMEERPGYSFFPLPEAPFKRIRICLRKDLVNVIRTEEPFPVFQFRHPLMCGAFVAYAEKLMEECGKDREEIKRRLGSRYM